MAIRFVPSTGDLGTIISASDSFEFNTGNDFTGSKMFVFNAYVYKNNQWEWVASKELTATPNITTNISFKFISNSYNWVVAGGINGKIVITPKDNTSDICFTGVANIKVRNFYIASPNNNASYDTHPKISFNCTNYKNVPCYYTINDNIGYNIDFTSDNQTYNYQLDESVNTELVTGLNAIKIYIDNKLYYTLKYTKNSVEPEIPEQDPTVELKCPVNTRKYCEVPKVYAVVTNGNGQKVSIYINDALWGTYDINSDNYVLQETLNSYATGNECTLEIRKHNTGSVLASTTFTRTTSIDPAVELIVRNPTDNLVTTEKTLEVDYTIKNAMNRYRFIVVRDENETIYSTLTSVTETQEVTKKTSVGMKNGKNVYKFYGCDFDGDPYQKLLKTINVTYEEQPTEIPPSITITSPANNSTHNEHPAIQFVANNALNKEVYMFINNSSVSSMIINSNSESRTFTGVGNHAVEGLNNIKLKIDNVTLAEVNYTKQTTIESGVFFAEPMNNSTHDVPPRIGIGHKNAKDVSYKIFLNDVEYDGGTIKYDGMGTVYNYNVTPYNVYGQNKLQLKVNNEVVSEVNYEYTRQGEPSINIISPVEGQAYDEQPELIINYSNVHSRRYRSYLNNVYMEQDDITEHEQQHTFKIPAEKGKVGKNTIKIQDIYTNEIVAEVNYIKNADPSAKSITITSPESGSLHYVHPSLRFNVYNSTGDTCDIFVNGTRDFQYVVKTNSDSVAYNLEDASSHEGFNEIVIKIDNVELARCNYTKTTDSGPGPDPDPDPEYKLKLDIPRLTSPITSLSNVEVTSECTNNTRLEVTVEYNEKRIKDYLDFDAGIQTKYFTFNSNLWNEIPENSKLMVTFKLIDNTDNSKFVIKNYTGTKTNSIINISYSTSTSEKITKLLLTADYVVGENIKVEFTNNPNATSPTWEDVTYKFLTNKIHIFPNIDVENPGYGFRITMTGSASKISNFIVYTS